jgi:glycosyltransferase involved in cell wall biosynthesis
MSHPRITVLMPVYNAAKYLKESVQSILDQSFANFEFLIFNDGSTDESGAIVRQFLDPRIKLFDSAENYGYVYHLNQGICMARGEYIARMDADDVSHPERFAKQIYFLDAHPEVGICGTCFDLIDNGRPIILPQDDAAIRISAFSGSPFGHPTVMMRTNLLRDNNLFYDNSLVPAEDYHLWLAIAQHTKLANLPDILLHYRVHEGQISNRKAQIQSDHAQMARNSLIENLINRPLLDEEKHLSRHLFEKTDLIFDVNLISCIHGWIKNLIAANQAAGLYDKSKFSTMLYQRLDGMIKKHYMQQFMLAPAYDLKLLKRFLFAKPLPFKHFGKKAHLTFILKCFFHWKPANESSFLLGESK